jgi:geranylgeranyl pyrophosphate synthase
VAEASDLIESWHGRADAEALARTHLDAALGALDTAALVPEAARELADLARFVVERDS